MASFEKSIAQLTSGKNKAFSSRDDATAQRFKTSPRSKIFIASLRRRVKQAVDVPFLDVRTLL